MSKPYTLTPATNVRNVDQPLTTPLMVDVAGKTANECARDEVMHIANLSLPSIVIKLSALSIYGLNSSKFYLDVIYKDGSANFDISLDVSVTLPNIEHLHLFMAIQVAEFLKSHDVTPPKELDFLEDEDLTFFNHVIRLNNQVDMVNRVIPITERERFMPNKLLVSFVESVWIREGKKVVSGVYQSNFGKKLMPLNYAAFYNFVNLLWGMAEEDDKRFEQAVREEISSRSDAGLSDPLALDWISYIIDAHAFRKDALTIDDFFEIMTVVDIMYSRPKSVIENVVPKMTILDPRLVDVNTIKIAHRRLHNVFDDLKTYYGVTGR